MLPIISKAEVDSIQLQALRDVHHGGIDYFIRCLYRWYSKTFATPLEHAYDIPIAEIFQHWCEEKYEVMSAQRLDEEIRRILTPPQELERQILDEERDEFEIAELIKEVVKAEQSETPVEVEDPKQLSEDTIEQLRVKPPPDVRVKFVEEAEFEEEINGFGPGMHPVRVR